MATGVLRPPDELVRFTLDPHGRLIPDLGNKLPGRGAYASANREAIATAAVRGLFQRALKSSGSMEKPDADALAEQVRQGLAERLLAALGLARRAGKLVAGFEKTAELLRDGRAGVVLIAIDAGADGRSKIIRFAQNAPVIAVFTMAAQSAAIGSDGAVYAAVMKGAEADRILREARRLDGFEPMFATRGCTATDPAAAPAIE